MSHSLHRRGAEDSLRRDFILISVVTEKLRTAWSSVKKRMKALEAVCRKYEPENCDGGTYYFQGCYCESTRVKEMVRELKKASLGISVVLTGPMDETIRMAGELGLELNAVHLSIGVFGDRSLLPDEKILEMTTMCGHHLVSPFLVQKMADALIKGKVDLDEAVSHISSLCRCNIFNPSRAREILAQLTGSA